MDAAVNFMQKVRAFESLLDTVVIEIISPEIYCKKYLGHLLNHKKYYLAIYADVLTRLIEGCNKALEDITLIDFGAGNGLLGIFARYCGFKKVYVNDIDENFLNASRELAQQLKINVDGFIQGDIHAVKQYFNSEFPNAIIGTDVIEHVYNLHDFFDTLKKINPSIVSIFTTASNPGNYFKIKRLKQLQLKDEYEGGTPEDFILFGDTALEPFIKIRQDIIRSEFKDIDDETLLTLSKATRGMNKEDILSVIKQYSENGEIPNPPLHPTNTCNPLNGSWTEHIVPLTEYQSLYATNGMKLKIYNGFYNKFKNGVGGILNKLLNTLVICTGRAFAPYIIFVGTKK